MFKGWGSGAAPCALHGLKFVTLPGGGATGCYILIIIIVKVRDPMPSHMNVYVQEC